jgi:hypothetical protein
MHRRSLPPQGCKTAYFTGISRVRRIRFTLPFRKTITIDAETIGNARAETQAVGFRPAIGAAPGRLSNAPNRPDTVRQRSRNLLLADLGGRTPGTERRQGLNVVPRGTRASANTSGPDFTWALGPGEIADQRSAPNEETCSSAGPAFDKSELLESTIRPFDLMSRRHPLSSTRAAGLKTAPRSGMS